MKISSSKNEYITLGLGLQGKCNAFAKDPEKIDLRTAESRYRADYQGTVAYTGVELQLTQAEF